MQKERKGQLVRKVVIMAVAIATAIAAIIAIVGIVEIRNTYHEMVEEVLITATSQADSEFTMMWDGDWAYEDGVLTKGGEEVYDEYLSTMEALKKETGLEYTIFYNDTRVCTTLKDQSGAYLTDTQASAAVVSEVIGNGQNSYKQNLD
ncbi:MAG: cache domain-containing protein, partial [Lachnospiraceae bacterium]|nr:cache domain-containing protein [Lachnospiraceae bacterium]